ncbi:MAG: hypothetical protein A3G38_02350 [Omnitrophica WOR_2 bacterium RIFCSPLOWO2_12_FULL_51_8]|nr:MAG: hypothetical protein A3G38_02350 [Omnitrophica WOR_2 bacterium RIFCSPLOWO2_12_FULL_51_8]
MTEKEKYFAQELFLTFLLLCAVIFLLGDVLAGFKYFVILALAGGFSFSYFNQKAPERLVKTAVDIASVAAFLWLVFSVFNSSLYYREVIAACVRGAFIFAAAFSFGSAYGSSLHYIQAASLPLFMSFPVLETGYSPFSLALILGYIIGWAALFRVKFYAAFRTAKPTQRIYSRRDYSNISLFIIFLAVVSLSWALFSRIPLAPSQKGGIFPVPDTERQMQEENLEKEYYRLQEELQKGIIRLIPSFPGADERFEVLGLLDSLLKEWPYYTMRVEDAEEGLRSRLKNLGPGIEEGDGKHITLVMESYVRAKTALALKLLSKEMTSQLKKNPFNIFDRLNTLAQMHGLRTAKSYRKVQAAGRSLKDSIAYSSLGAEVKKRLFGLSADFKEWKDYDGYRQKIAGLEAGLAEFSAVEAEGILGILNGIRQLENPADYAALDSQIAQLEGSTSPELKEAGDGLDEVLSFRLELLLAQKLRELEKKIETAGLPHYLAAEFKEEITALKTTEGKERFAEEAQRLRERAGGYNIDIAGQTEELSTAKAGASAKERQAAAEVTFEPQQTAPPPAEEGPRPDEPQTVSSRALLPRLLRRIIPFLFAGIAVFFSVLYYLTRKKQKELLGLFLQDPRGFVIRLYQNLRQVFGIFGLRDNSFITSFQYALTAQEKFSIADNLFLNFSAKYQEARCSQHAFKGEDSAAALEVYNSCLKKMFEKTSRWVLFYCYLLTLMRKSPLLIGEGGIR